MTYDMTPLRLYVTCIKIIDTIILTNYTNDAYYYDTHLSGGVREPVCITIIDTMYHNNRHNYTD
jgi:hypothetical protein